MKYDDLVASGTWNGPRLALYSRVADYLVDGHRLGTIDWPTRSGAPSDVDLDKRSSETLAVALTFGLLGFDGIRLASTDAAGRKLECPDFDVTFPDETLVGIETADVIATSQGKHERETAAVTSGIMRLIRDDPTFAGSFGKHNVVVFLSSHIVGRYQIASKNERIAILSELERFLRSRTHWSCASAQAFPLAYPILHARGATWHSSSHPVPHFALAHGTSNVSGNPALPDLLRVLNDHRVAAARYRPVPLWLVLLLPERWEFLRRTIDAVVAAPPPIAPFARCYLTDDSGQVLELRDGVPPLLHQAA